MTDSLAAGWSERVRVLYHCSLAAPRCARGSWLAVASVLCGLSCGGRTSDAAPGSPPESTESEPIACHDAETPTTCAPLVVDIGLAVVGRADLAVWSEPLQISDSPVSGETPDWRIPDDAEWDRSALPAGACVFKLHGLSAECARAGTLFAEACSAGQQVAPASFYDTAECARSVAPGCPSANPAGPGDWWYLVPRGADSDLVMCAPLCKLAVAVGTSCLRLR